MCALNGKPEHVPEPAPGMNVQVIELPPAPTAPPPAAQEVEVAQVAHAADEEFAVVTATPVSRDTSYTGIPSAGAGGGNPTLSQKLGELEDAKAAGLISEEEYSSARKGALAGF